MFLLLRSLVALAFAGGAVSPLAQETAPSEDVAIEASVDTGAAAVCESTPDEPVYSMSEDPESAVFGFCFHDCSRCRTRADCVSPEFPNGAACTTIALCLTDESSTP